MSTRGRTEPIKHRQAGYRGAEQGSTMIWDHHLEQPLLRMKERTDWRTAQTVDDTLDMLRARYRTYR